MDRNEILNMPSGRDMDALIAEKIMDYKVDGNIVIFDNGDHSYLVPDLGGHWSPSQDISLAFEISEKMGDKIGNDETLVVQNGMNYLTLTQLGSFGIRYAASFDCIYDDNEWFDDASIGEYPYAAKAETAALAMCRALLLVAEVINDGPVR